MTHLLAGLLRAHDPWFCALLFVEAVLGAGSVLALLMRLSGRRARWSTLLLLGLIGACVSWATFLTALAGTYPKLSLAVPLGWALPALAMSLCSSLAAGLIQQRARRSARNTMFAGSLLASGFSCMVFIGMAGLVRPFTLGYDLTAVVTIMIVGAALCGFALLELGNPDRPHRWLVATTLCTIAIAVLAFGSLAAVLPFDAWIVTVSARDNLTSSPIVIIIAAEAIGVLAFGLSGSLVDNRAAARDKYETDRLRQLTDSAFEGILIHRDGEILDGNVSLAALLGVAPHELGGVPLTTFLAPNADMAVWKAESGAQPFETEIIAADGDRRAVEILSRQITYRGHPALVTALRDVRERKISEERIRFLAHHDVLTELPNRALLTERLAQAVAMAARHTSPLAVLCLDLDGFKLINDTLGHAAGDQLLCQVADRLRAGLRVTDFVARIGGDEFVVLQSGGTPPDSAAELSRRIIASLAPSFQVAGQDVNVGVSIGISIYPRDGDTPTAMMKSADIALYQAKEKGRGWFCHYESGMDRSIREQLEMQQDLRAALDQDELALQFQPLFNQNLEPIAFEALVRWMHPTLGLIAPAEFIPLAEACGVIIPLGEWVVRTACRAAMQWSQSCRVAVNLSPCQFRREDLRQVIAELLAETGLPAERLELEITEGVLMDNTEHAMRTLADLRSLGTRLVLDDFGTGYSSLSYLQRFSFDKLKIDQSFVQRLETDRGSRAIVSAIVAMSHSLDIEVTAEGVESLAQLDLLRSLGCNEFQGFLLGIPLPQHEVVAALQTRSGAPAPPPLYSASFSAPRAHDLEGAEPLT